MRLLLAAALLATVMLANSPPAAAIGRIRVQAAAVQSNGATLAQVDARLSIHSARRSTFTLHTGRIQLPSGFESQTGVLQGVSLTCVDPVVREPLLACPRLSVQLRTEKLSTLTAQAQVRYEMNRGTLTASGTGPDIAGATPTFKLAYTPQGWKAEASLPPMPVSAWRTSSSHGCPCPSRSRFLVKQHWVCTSKGAR